MATRNVRIVMNGVTGRMGYRQHLLRSVLAIRDDGGITLPDGGRLQVEPVLVGRNHAKLAGIARAHDVADFTTDLDAALADESATVYFDAKATGGRRKTILTAIAAGKHVSATGSFPATCSRRSARAGTTAPRRRRHRPGHVLALELRPGEPVRPGARGDREGRRRRIEMGSS